MDRKYKIITVFIIILLVAGCASKKFAKQADKYAEAGMYKNAAEMYYKSVAANKKNIDAKMGLQRTGQLLLQDKFETFKTHYKNNAVKEAVYAYIEADNYYNKVKSVGVNLIYPAENKVYWEEVKEKYLDQRYSEGMQALDAEEFATSESIFSEILSIDPSYKDSKTHWITSKYEPIYRRGIDELNSDFFRKAYYSFDDIIKGTGTYKNTLELKNEALDKAMITIAIAPFYINYSTYYQTSQSLQNSIIKGINQINSPFYKIVADPVIATLPNNGRKSRLKDLIPYISAYSRGISAKAILTGNITRLIERQGETIEETKPGYIKNVISYIDKETGEKKTKNEFIKTNYKEYSKENKTTFIFEYSLIDVATGTIIVSDVFNLTKNDKIHYAEYNGDTKKLVPGYWKQRDKDSPEDRIDDNNNSITNLKNLLSASKEIKSPQTITHEIISEITEKLVHSIENYNPEK